LCLGCSLWTREENTAADNGVFYAIISGSECMVECLTSTTCVGFDLTPFGCTLHNNAHDLASAYYALGVTQFILNRHCLVTSPVSTESAHTTTTLIQTTTGIYSQSICRFCSITYWRLKDGVSDRTVVAWNEMMDDDMMQWRSQRFSTGGASICSIPFCAFPFSCPIWEKLLAHLLGFTRRPITLRNHIPKNYVFSWQRVRTPLRHLFGYATDMMSKS